jgi:hypothetical protein
VSLNYTGIRNFEDKAEAARCAERLLDLRSKLAPLRAQNTPDSLMLATWNIRDFGAIGKFGSPGRRNESFYYMAEILSVFDLIAVQEVNEDLDEFKRLMGVLGSDWTYLLTDVTEGRGGNGERMAYVFNKDKVRFLGIAGEIVLPSGQLIVPPHKATAAATRALVAAAESNPNANPVADAETLSAKEVHGQQFARTPFLVAFQAGWFHFNLCTVHIYYGDDSGPNYERRVEEIRRLVNFFANRQQSENKALNAKAVARARKRGLPEPEKAVPGPQEYENYLLLGDFNVVGFEDATMDALERRGFKVPEPIRSIDETGMPEVKRPHFYDQIAVSVKDERFAVTAGGIVDIWEAVYRDVDEATYAEWVPREDESDDEDEFRATTPEARYKKWRTWQLSDHWPLWVKIKTDFSNDYLSALK